MRAAKTAIALALASMTGLAQAQLALEEVVVTAQKKEASLQDTPIAITAFSSDSLEQIGAFNPTQISEYAPNVNITKTFGSAGNIRTNIRGVSTGEPSLTVDPKVGMYVDGVYVARNAGAVFDIVDLERIEIMRGPQGTLWGKNTTGGALNIITKKPQGELGFKQVLTFGNDALFRSTTTLDTPTAAGFSAKLSYMYKDYDGWAENHNPVAEEDLGSEQVDAYRIAVRWENDSVTADYSYDRSDMNAVPMPLQISKVGPGSEVNSTFDVTTSTFYSGVNALREMLSVEEPKDRVEDFFVDGQSEEKTDVSGHNLTLTWDTDLMQIKSITAYREYDSRFDGNDLDGGSWQTPDGVPLAQFHARNTKEQDQFSQEFQFIGTAFDDKLDYVIGLFYFEEEGEEINPWDAGLFPNLPSQPVILKGLGAVAGSWYGIENESQAIYSQFKYYINENWDVTLGLRYTEDDKELILLDEDPRIEGEQSFDESWSESTIDFMVGYRINEDINLYFKRAEGYNAGVYSASQFNHSDYTDFSGFVPADPEELTSYELGMKSEWFDRTLRFNAAIYYNENENLQATEVVNGIRVIRNTGENESWGAEMDFQALMGDAFTLEGSWGYRDTNDKSTSNSRAREGFHQGSLSLIYAQPMNWGYLDARFNVTYQDDQLFSSSVYGNSDSYTLYSARFGVSEIQLGDAGSVRVAIWGNNLTDEEYVAYGQDLGVNQGLGYAGISFGAPRTYGIDFTYEF
jgi:iron complex outermembrane receptor protein